MKFLGSQVGRVTPCAPKCGLFQARRRWCHAPGLALSLLCLLTLFATPGMAAVALPPKPEGYFNDYAKVVSTATAVRLNETLAEFERSTSSQIMVAVFPS